MLKKDQACQKILFLMGFKGDHRFRRSGIDKFKYGSEIYVAFAHTEMAVLVAAIVVQMELADIFSSAFQPLVQGYFPNAAKCPASRQWPAYSGLRSSST